MNRRLLYSFSNCDCSSGKVDFESMLPQHPRTNEDVVCIYEGGLGSLIAIAKREVNKVPILFNSLATCQQRRYFSEILRVDAVAKCRRQLQVAIESGVDDCRPSLAGNLQRNHRNTIVGDDTGDHRRPPLR